MIADVSNYILISFEKCRNNAKHVFRIIRILWWHVFTSGKKLFMLVEKVVLLLKILE